MSDIDTRIDDRSIDQPATYDGSDPGSEAGAMGSQAFLADLARAMQATVEAQRVQVVAAADERRKAHIAGIREREDAGVEELREIASQDVKGIEIWATGEIERIRLERQRRVAARKADLERRLEDHHQLIEREVDAVERSVSGYREEVDGFFNGLDAESDPVLIARQAANLPPFPALELIGPDDDPSVAKSAWSAPSAAAPSAWTNGTSSPNGAAGYAPSDVIPAEDVSPATPDAEVATVDAAGDSPVEAVAGTEIPTNEAEADTPVASESDAPSAVDTDTPAAVEADGGSSDETPSDGTDGSAGSGDGDGTPEPALVGVMDPDALIGVESSAAQSSSAGYIAPWDRHVPAVADAQVDEFASTDAEGSDVVSATAGTLRIAPRSSGAVAHSGPTLRPIGSWLRRLNHS